MHFKSNSRTALLQLDYNVGLRADFRDAQLIIKLWHAEFLASLLNHLFNETQETFSYCLNIRLLLYEPQFNHKVLESGLGSYEESFVVPKVDNNLT